MAQTPFRHGHDWHRSQPTPASPVGVQARNPFQLQPGTPLPSADQQPGVVPVHEVGVISTQTLHAFYEALPDPSVQQLTKVVEAHWPHASTVGSILSLSTFAVPAQFVYILTDVLYYATCPSSFLEGPPVQLEAYQLTGLVHFELTLGDRQPMRIDSSMFSPYGDANTAAAAASGWSMLDQVFGARRGGSFALYARSSQEVKVQVVIDVVPRFSLTKLGAHFHGFAVPEGLFDDIFRRIKGGT